MGYDVEAPGFADLSTNTGAIDAFLAAQSVGQAAVDEGRTIRTLGEPPYYAYSAPAVDRRSGRSQAALLARVNGIIADMHKDGTLKQLAIAAFGTDHATQAASFDVAALDQTVPWDRAR